MIAETIGKQTAKTIRYIKPVLDDRSEVYRQIRAEFLPVPPLILHSPAPQVLAGYWSIFRETLLVGQVDRALKEAMAAAVSKTNECPYCVDVHTMMLHATSDHNVASAILRGDYDSIRDPQFDALVQWTLANRTANTQEVPAPPFALNEAPEIIGTALAFHYINRMVNVFLGDSFVPVPTTLKGLTGRLFGVTAGKRLIHPSLQPGDSLKFVPAAELPDDLSWAAANPAVAGAIAGFADVIEAAGTEVLPEIVRALLKARVNAWNGEAMGISRRWVEDIVLEIEAEHRAASRLVLLTALASYQVNARVVEDFQSQYPSDAQLIAATAWASFTAARRVSVWLAVPFKTAERER